MGDKEWRKGHRFAYPRSSSSNNRRLFVGAGKSLRAAVEKVAKGDHEDAMVLRLENRVDAQCSLLMKAMKGMGTDEGAIARVLGGSDKDTVQEIHARYDEKYGGNLVGQLKDECRPVQHY